MIDEHFLEPHHVADRNPGKLQRILAAGRRIDRGRTGGAAAAAEHVRAQNEVLVRIKSLARPDHVVPPSRLAFMTDAGRVGVAGKGMQDENRVRFRSVQLAISFVGDVNGRERGAIVQRYRIKSDSLRFYNHGWIYS